MPCAGPIHVEYASAAQFLRQSGWAAARGESLSSTPNRSMLAHLDPLNASGRVGFPLIDSSVERRRLIFPSIQYQMNLMSPRRGGRLHETPELGS